MTSRARALRREATAEERAIWALLRETRPRFTRQLPVGPYIVDLACRSRRVAVELDGSQHLDASSYDAARTAFLERLGWRVLRFWNSDVRANPEGVAEAILAVVGECGGPTHPRPLPCSREGS
jgi:very-short-patch-repair endonuclease